jgi:hypothetical protein
MAIFDRVRALLRQRPDDDVHTTMDETPAPRRPNEALARFAADRERVEIVKRCREMYDTDTRAKEVIQTLARDMTRGGFTVSAPGDPRAAEIGDALAKRLQLDTRLDDWVRLTLRDGDTFLEVGVSQEMEIAEVTRKPTLEMHRQSNQFDRFDDPEKAYWWADSFWGGAEAPQDAIWFADWQIIHARWDHDEDRRYGRPLFSSATGPWKRIVEGERDIAVRRKTRAGMKYNHKFPAGTDEKVIKAYREINKAALDNPWAAVADFFGTTEIEVVQGDARLAEIDDVEHHIRTWWLASPAPMSLLGYGQDLNRDVLEKQKEQYDEALPVLQAWVTDQLVRPLLELEWLLHGIWPEHLEYDVQWNRKQTLTPEALAKLADAALRLRALGWPQALVVEVLQMFIAGVDLSVLLGAEGAGTTEIGGVI